MEKPGEDFEDLSDEDDEEFERMLEEKENILQGFLESLVRAEKGDEIPFDGRLTLAQLPWGVSFPEEQIRRNLSPSAIYHGRMTIKVYDECGAVKPYRVYSKDRRFQMLMPVVGKWGIVLKDPNLKYSSEGPFVRANAINFGEGAEFRFYCKRRKSVRRS